MTTSVKNRLKFIKHYQATGNVAQTCRRFSISRQTFYKWHRRYKKYGVSGLSDRTSRPKRFRSPTPKKTITKILKLHLQKGWGAKRISDGLKKQGIKVSRSTADRVLRRHGF